VKICRGKVGSMPTYVKKMKIITIFQQNSKEKQECINKKIRAKEELTK
jgi:hypothetical protein